MKISPIIAAGAAASMVLLAPGCGTSTPKTTTTAPTSGSNSTGTTTAAKGSGPVDVLYAGSLVDTMNNTIGPAFDRATGYTFVGFPGGANGLASDIKGKVEQGDVFVSASPRPDQSLEGTSNGNWVSWYATFATTSLVLGYNPHSSFAAQLETKPWYRVVGQAGFKLGFTNPATDPKGVLAVDALDTAATKYDEPALKKIADEVHDQYPETALVGRLQSGQLDAGFFYTVEATAARLATVSLSPVTEVAPYTVTVLDRAPHPGPADAFVRFLLGSQGRSLLSGLELNVINPPTVSGTPPSSLSSVLPSS